MYRGEIRWVDFESAHGAEANKRRPAIIVSNDAANDATSALGHGVVTVVPVTSSVARVHPFQAFLPAVWTGLDRDSKALAEQVRSLSVERIGARIGQLTPDLGIEVDAALRLHLGL